MKIWIAVALLAATAAIDLFVLRVPLFSDGAPIFSSIYLLRSVFILLASALLVTYVGAAENGVSPRMFSQAGRNGRTYYLVMIGLGVFLSIAFVVLLRISAEAFYRFGLEDNLLENISALLWFAASGVFVVVMLRLQRRKGVAVIFKAAAAAFAVLYFVIGMEEVSWFQRVIDFETPQALREPPSIFEGNLQGEANLHNLSTTFFENAFYFSMFVFFVLLPFTFNHYSRLRESRLLCFFMPGYFLLLIGSLQVAFNYDMWNGILMQFAFYSTVLVLLSLAFEARGKSSESVVTTAVAATVLITQAAFLVLGDTLVRQWDVTEYKEFFLPFASFLYAIEILRKSQEFEFSGGTRSVSQAEASD